MKRLSALLFVLSFSLHVFAQSSTFSKPKLSAGTLQFLWKMNRNMADKNGALSDYVYRLDAENKLYVNAIIKVHPDYDEKEITQLGVKIGTKAGNIWTAQVPVQKMLDFTTVKGIQYIEMDQPMAPDLDSARRKTRVDSVHKGLGLSQAYSGKGTVVGIIDAGFDYTHPTLYDTAYNRYRIKRVWEEKNTTGTPPTGFSYGTEFSDSASIITKAHDITDGTHGTHVAGIAGGSGWGSPGGNNSKYRGMAFGSDMVFVAIYPSAQYWLNTGMADMLDGINYTFKYGQSVGKPAVANLSWGCPLGPRDGNSLFSQGVDNLTGPGKIFVLSVGNNGQNKIHTKKSFTATDTTFHTFLTFPNITPRKNQVDVWGDSAQSFCMTFSLYTGNTLDTTTQTICLDDSTHQLYLIGGSGDTCFITATAVASEFNNKPHMLLQFYSRIGDRLCLTVKASSGTVNLWQGIVVQTSGYYGTFTKYAYPWATDGNVQSTTGDLVSTRSAIAVAAYNSKISYVDVTGANQPYPGYLKDRIAAFSSLGPTADGRTKPNIAGPGLALASSVSSVDADYILGGSSYTSVVSKFVSPKNSNTYSYAMAAGTSMSSPATSGIVAILLEVNPTLKPQELMQLFAETAILDAYTGVIPPSGSNTWGFGKVNAYGSLKRLLEPTGIVHSKSSTSFLVFPNPGNGSYSVEYLSASNEELNVSVLDFLGRELQSKSWSVKEGSNIHPLSMASFPAGIYYVRLQTATGQTTVKIVKE